MLIMGQLVKGVYAISVAAVLVAALWPRTDSAQPIVQSIQAAPSAQPSPQPVDFYDPALNQAVQQVRSFDVALTARWVAFCTETNGGTGYGAGNELICRALQYR